MLSSSTQRSRFSTKPLRKDVLDLKRTQTIITLQESLESNVPEALLNDHVYDVVIVGAGWAGISAANLLAQRGKDNIKILEAKDHIGGRAYSVNHQWEDKEIPIDMGAMWLHGGTRNILNNLAIKYGVKTHVSKYDYKVYQENNQGPFDDETVKRCFEKLYNGGFFPFQAARQESTGIDESLKKTADLYIETLPDPVEKQMTKFLIRSLVDLEYSGKLKDHSLWWWNDDYDLGGSKESDDFFVPSGQNSLLVPFASPLVTSDKIMLNSPVKMINYQNRDIVEILHYDVDGNPMLSRTKRVIITVPLGVLQAGSISFSPKLPRWTQRSIKRLGFGQMNKIFLFWSREDVFWPYETEILGDITERDSNFLFCNPRIHNGDLPMLFAFFQGQTAEQLEKDYAESDPVRYENGIRDLAMESLRNMFGNDIPMPEKVVVSKWNVDEYTLGAYSFNKVGMGPHDRHLLSQPIGKNQVFIAGEATHTRFFATIAGAFLTGRTAARRVLKSLEIE